MKPSPFQITPLLPHLDEELQHKINHKTKPLGALGRLENIAFQIGRIQQTTTPKLNKPMIVVFAGDHGAATHSGISAYPQEVTFQMVLNFLGGGAAINVFCQQNQLDLYVVDTGVNYDFSSPSALMDYKIAKGTQNYLKEPAMTKQQCTDAMSNGVAIVEQMWHKGCNVIGFGEMGIGNTASASLLFHTLTEHSLSDCVGAGTGLDQEGVQRKIQLLQQALDTNGKPKSPLDALQLYGGFEIATMCGAFLKAAEQKMLILVDGFIATASLLVASQMYPHLLEYCLFCHQSEEKGHRLLLQHLNASPLLELQMRLGEGTGVAVCYPIIESAVQFLNHMASFEQAGVHERK